MKLTSSTSILPLTEKMFLNLTVCLSLGLISLYSTIGFADVLPKGSAPTQNTAAKKSVVPEKTSENKTPQETFKIEIKKEVVKKKGCEATREYSQIKSLDNPTVLKKLNDYFKKSADQNSCTSPDDFPEAGSPIGYSFENFAKITNVINHRFAALEIGSWSFTGGAHGNGGTQCEIMDLTNGASVDLKKHLTKGAHKLVEKYLIDNYHQGNAEHYKQFASDMQITEKHICLNSTHEGFYFQFNPYEVGPYSDGSPKVDVAAKDWKKYFEVNDLTKSIFGN